MNLATLDLNLLVALDALLFEGHVGRAARKLGRSQPATSHALNRLRDLLSDPLLVRVGSRMELTPRAINLREEVPQILQRVQNLLVSEKFEPRKSSLTDLYSWLLEAQPSGKPLDSYVGVPDGI